MTTIEEPPGSIQKLLVAGFETTIRKLGIFRALQSIASAGPSTNLSDLGRRRRSIFITGIDHDDASGS